jgi:TPR repeat protein
MHDDVGKVLRSLILAGGCGLALVAASAALPVEAKPTAPAATPAAKKQIPPSGTVTPPVPAASAAAPVADPAYAAFEKRNYALARKLAEEGAARGEPSAHTLLGQIYEQGLGVPQDYAKAADWYMKGAVLGDAHSQFCLGMMLVEGRGVTKNKKRAAEFFELAAAKNHPHAQYNLALLYAEGVVYPQDYGKVAMWLEKAAAQNHAQAEYDLGAMYNSGTGVNKDEAKAERLIGLAAKEGLPDAELDYAIILLRRALPPKPHPQPAEDARRALIDEGVKYLRMAAEKGNPVAQNRLAKAYVDGFYGAVERDPVMAAKWHLIARAGGATDGRLDLFLTTLTPDQRRRADSSVQAWRADAGLPSQ